MYNIGTRSILICDSYSLLRSRVNYALSDCKMSQGMHCEQLFSLKTEHQNQCTDVGLKDVIFAPWEYCMNNTLKWIAESFVQQTKEWTHHMTSLEYLSNIGNRTFCKPRQHFSQFHLKSVSVLFLTAHPRQVSCNLVIVFFKPIFDMCPFLKPFKRLYSYSAVEFLQQF